ncbi:phospholysine phosphohistidine inorganic pyrophosphate phosphatase isoform X2 [Desmodus rotundus]|uniref:phospholysine phosphohistidine inorganic pyrophosphate phosphatase isoform X2 n=1 Tax=Desmodus rotundus TaxID=9430 RepID=UPI0023817A2A|nr:phospholysine phosphohistidine inorganic pyrophosphate phosphatase isoform X2 [Desmodus rotundus]
MVQSTVPCFQGCRSPAKENTTGALVLPVLLNFCYFHRCLLASICYDFCPLSCGEDSPRGHVTPKPDHSARPLPDGPTPLHYTSQASLRCERSRSFQPRVGTLNPRCTAGRDGRVGRATGWCARGAARHLGRSVRQRRGWRQGDRWLPGGGGETEAVGAEGEVLHQRVSEVPQTPGGGASPPGLRHLRERGDLPTPGCLSDPEGARPSATPACPRRRYYKITSGLILDIGGYTKALEYACGIQAEVVGKPSPEFFKSALREMGVEAHQAQ